MSRVHAQGVYRPLADTEAGHWEQLRSSLEGAVTLTSVPLVSYLELGEVTAITRNPEVSALRLKGVLTPDKLGPLYAIFTRAYFTNNVLRVALPREDPAGLVEIRQALDLGELPATFVPGMKIGETTPGCDREAALRVAGEQWVGRVMKLDWVHIAGHDIRSLGKPPK